MLFNIGDIVTRKSYNHDTYFTIISINGDVAYLKGINLRLYADSDISDLEKLFLALKRELGARIANKIFFDNAYNFFNVNL